MNNIMNKYHKLKRFYKMINFLIDLMEKVYKCAGKIDSF